MGGKKRKGGSGGVVEPWRYSCSGGETRYAKIPTTPGGGSKKDVELVKRAQRMPEPRGKRHAKMGFVGQKCFLFPNGGGLRKRKKKGRWRKFLGNGKKTWFLEKPYPLGGKPGGHNIGGEGSESPPRKRMVEKHSVKIVRQMGQGYSEK